jgi:hypothetical protein
MKVTEGSSGGYRWPVHVRTYIGMVELRLGDPGRGSRPMRLEPSAARLLAYALLSEVERVESAKKSN